MKKGFTLIELLIVVAIIAILAAIAVPNFLEAQTRAKISRVKNDLRTVEVTLQSYRVDYNAFPIPFVAARGMDTVFEITTPVAYITSLPQDPYNRAKAWANPDGTVTMFPTPVVDNYKYMNFKHINAATSYGQSRSWPVQAGITSQVAPQDCFLIYSYGPDEMQSVLEGWVAGLWESTFSLDALYDPTNGTVSKGDIGRVGGSPTYQMGKVITGGK